MDYRPSKEILQTFVNYLRGRSTEGQIILAELSRALLTKAESRHLLDYLIPADVIKKERGGGYFLACPRDTAINTLTILIDNGPIIYPINPDDPVKIHRRLKDYPSPVRLNIHNCEIQALPSKYTIQELNEQIVQGKTLIVPQIKIDAVNLWLLEKFFSEMKIADGDFGFTEKGIAIPAEGLYRFSALNIAQSATEPVAVLTYLSTNADGLNSFREQAEALMEYERREVSSYPEATDNFFWSDFSGNVVPFVRENFERIREDLIEGVMKTWHPKVSSKVEETVTEKAEIGKGGMNSLLKRLFRV